MSFETIMRKSRFLCTLGIALFLFGSTFGEEIKNDKANKNGLVDEKYTTESSVLNPGFVNQPQTFFSLGNDIKLEIDGKYRVDAISYGKNTKLLNSANNICGGLDKFIVPGKHTFDLGIGIGYGENTYGHQIVTFGCDMRSRLVWGKADSISTTSITAIKDGEYVFGSHQHQLGLPVIFLRGADLTLDINALYGLNLCSQHFFKLGVFPFEVGRGISLGAAYGISSDFIVYDPVNTIQEYAPGFLFYGSLGNKKIVDYRLYLGILNNKSANFNDVNERVNAQLYGQRFDAARGFGVLNLVSAATCDIKMCQEKGFERTLSPYLILWRSTEELIDFVGDGRTLMGTFGLSMEAKHEKHEFSLEVAGNRGKQKVFGVDRNIVTRQSRDSVPGLQGVPVLVNSHVNYTGAPSNNDITNGNAVYLQGSPRQSAIFAVYPSQASNGVAINGFSLANAVNRFRDGYTNYLDGCMAVADYSYQLCLFDTDVKASLAVAYASGDDNPNKSLLKSDDYAVDGTYSGFIGIQEIYSGKRVQSVFMLSGVGKIPRILSIPARLFSDNGTSNVIDYPSTVSKFTNIVYTGGSLDWKCNSQNFTYKIRPNILTYWQPVAAQIFDQTIIDKLGKNFVSKFLGTELNMFVEIKPHHIEGLQFYATCAWFIPGSYYKDISGIPLSRNQQKFLDSFDSSGTVVEFVPTLGHDSAFYGVFGVEYRF